MEYRIISLTGSFTKKEIFYPQKKVKRFFMKDKWKYFYKERNPICFESSIEAKKWIEEEREEIIFRVCWRETS